ncbi:MAG: aminoacyl-tRNA deacylase [Mycobacteriales bacterium]
MRGPMDVHRELLGAEVAHEIVHLPRVVQGADEVPEVLDLPPSSCAAVRLYAPAGPGLAHRLVAVVVPAGTWPDERTLTQVVGRPVRPATDDEINSATDYAAALVCPIGLPADLQVIVDGVLCTPDVLYLPAGDSGTVLGIHSRDLVAQTRAQVSDTRAASTPSLATAG